MSIGTVVRGQPPYPFTTQYSPRLGAPSLAAVLLALIMLASASASQISTVRSSSTQIIWAQEHPTVSPPKLRGMELVYDSASGYVVAFGGSTVNDVPIQETWTYASGNWTQLQTTNSPPVSGSVTNIAYDNATGQVIYFGGVTERVSGHPQYGFLPLNETWAFSNGSWAQLHPANAPGVMNYGLMTYDPTAKGLLLYDSGYNGYGSGNDSTWLFKGGSWSHFSKAGAPMADPSGMAFDPTLHGVLMAGYENGTNSSWGVSIFQHGNWSSFAPEVGPSLPSIPLVDTYGPQSLVFDSQLSQVILITGGNASLHVWKYRFGTWTAIAPSGSAPSSRFNFGATFDAKDGYLVLFGGVKEFGHFSNQTWSLD
jgi:hypothetical protein